MTDDCNATRGRLSAYVDDELPAGEASSVDLHLGTCAGCREELAALRENVEDVRAVFHEVLRDAPPAPDLAPGSARPSSSALRPVRRGPTPVLAAVLLATAASLAILTFAWLREDDGTAPATAVRAAAARLIEADAVRARTSLGDRSIRFVFVPSTKRVAWRAGETGSDRTDLAGGFDGETVWLYAPGNGVYGEPDGAEKWFPESLPVEWPAPCGPRWVEILHTLAAGEFAVTDAVRGDDEWTVSVTPLAEPSWKLELVLLSAPEAPALDAASVATPESEYTGLVDVLDEGETLDLAFAPSPSMGPVLDAATSGHDYRTWLRPLDLDQVEMLNSLGYTGD